MQVNKDYRPRGAGPWFTLELLSRGPIEVAHELWNLQKLRPPPALCHRIPCYPSACRRLFSLEGTAFVLVHWPKMILSSEEAQRRKELFSRVECRLLCLHLLEGRSGHRVALCPDVCKKITDQLPPVYGLNRKA